MKVRFRDIPNSNHGDAAVGTIDLSEDKILDDYVGRKINYEISITYSDFPFDEITNTGVLSKVGSDIFYDFKILKVNTERGKGSKGLLSIIGQHKVD